MFTAYGNAVNAQSIQVSLTAIMSRTTNEHNNEITFGLSLKLKLCQLSISPGMSGTVWVKTLGCTDEVMTIHHDEGKGGSSSACMAVNNSHDVMGYSGHSLTAPPDHCHTCQGGHPAPLLLWWGLFRPAWLKIKRSQSQPRCSYTTASLHEDHFTAALAIWVSFLHFSVGQILQACKSHGASKICTTSASGSRGVCCPLGSLNSLGQSPICIPTAPGNDVGVIGNV